MALTSLYHAACTEVVSVQDGQYTLHHCTATGVEGLTSGLEMESFDAWVTEHTAAHAKRQDDQWRAADARAARDHALWTYRNTEPNDPRRNGIGVHLNYR